MIRKFREIVWEKSHELYREMPWRSEPTFHHVLVSELMLQQTQVPRVLVKFDEFMTAFPTLDTLAAASLADVLRVWQGLGYNRRAKFLHESAKVIVKDPEFHLLISTGPNVRPSPKEKEVLRAKLVALPGIGKNTAAAIMNYVYEIPTPYVETNIRTVYFHHFFEDQTEVHDKEILEIVEATLDTEHPREWFWALMDYGTWLKSQGYARLDASKHYKRQSPLKGSVREVRGQIVRALSAETMTLDILKQKIAADDRFDRALTGLVGDGLVQQSGDLLYLTK